MLTKTSDRANCFSSPRGYSKLKYIHVPPIRNSEEPQEMRAQHSLKEIDCNYYVHWRTLPLSSSPSSMLLNKLTYPAQPHRVLLDVLILVEDV